MSGRALLGVVHRFAGGELADPGLQRLLVGQGKQQTQGLRVEALLGEIQIETTGLGRQGGRSTGVLAEQILEPDIADLFRMRGKTPPGQGLWQ